MKLKTLLHRFPDIEAIGPREIRITGVCADSRFVAPGNLFVARKGQTYDGNHYIPEAVAAGATAILTDLFDPSFRHVTQLVHKDINRLEADLAAYVYNYPSDDLFAVGVTGTNGKTTVSYLIYHLLEASGIPCGLMGTIEHIVGSQSYQATGTTPPVTVTQRVLREMVRAGCQAAVMEATSHGLVQGRTKNVAFDVGVFTNLTQDHLDYHGTLDAYARAKALLFDQVSFAVVNGDDPWHKLMIESCQQPILKYGFSPDLDLRAENLELTADGSHFDLFYRGDKFRAFLPLIGRFNVANALAALGACSSKHLPFSQLVHLLGSVPPVPGRLEAVPNTRGLHVYVDFAHTPDALEKALSCLQEVSRQRIVTVFGCGGDRDRTKRPLMGEVASRLSTRVIVTSDNPRSEDPQEICDQIVASLTGRGNWEVCIDRRAAIQKAFEVASTGDIVLIAGKGHENYQLLGQRTIPFDDRRVAKELLH